VTATWPSSHEQFDSTKSSRRRFWRFLAPEERLGVAGKFENLHALVHIGLVGLAVAVDLARATSTRPSSLSTYIASIRC